MSNTTSSRKWIAASVAVAVWSVYSMVVLAAPGAKASGELSVSGNVTVNGLKAITGGTFFSDSSLITAEKSSASVSVGKLGRVELAPNSSLRLSFTDNSISGSLETGSAVVTTLEGVTVNLTTKDGSVFVDGSKATSFMVTTENGTVLNTQTGLAQLRSGGAAKMVAAGENATTGATLPQPAAAAADGGLSGGALAVLLIAAAGAVAGVIYATTSNNDLNFNGQVNVVSPSK